VPFLAVISAATAAAPFGSGPRVLALLDDQSVRETHSLYFEGPRKLDLQVDFKFFDEPSLSLKRYGEYLYDHVILFAPSADELGGGALTVEDLARFVDDGGNVLAVAGRGDLARDLAAEVGMEVDDAGAYVIDHLNFHEGMDDGQHTTVIADEANFLKAPDVVGAAVRPVLFRGVGMISDRANPLVLEILAGSASSYSHDPDEPITQYPHAVGKNTLLVGGLQARNNARVVVSGSLEMFSDTFFASSVRKGKASGNREFALAASRWCFQRSGVLRIHTVRHRRAGEEAPPAEGAYTVRDNIEFSAVIERLAADGQSWEPYKATDVQMEFVRIDPFVRITLKGDQKGLFRGKFEAPDVYGVFQFKVDYRSPGLTSLHSATQFSVRPLKHDQYERFIRSAFPYYASAFSMMLGVFLLSFVFLHIKEEEPKKKAE